MQNTEYNDINCVMCEDFITIENTLIPNICFKKHGKMAHRICENCWWNPISGFAREYASHKCPGCEKKLPLLKYKKNDPIFIDLTEE